MFYPPNVQQRQTAQTLGIGGYIVFHISFVSTFFLRAPSEKSEQGQERFMRNESVMLHYNNFSLYSPDISFYLLIKYPLRIKYIYFCSNGIYKYY